MEGGFIFGRGHVRSQSMDPWHHGATYSNMEFQVRIEWQ